MNRAPFDLTGKVALVTGAGRGLGRHIAEGLADAGARLTVGARSRPEVMALAAEIRARGGEAVAQPFDACQPDQVGELVSAAVDAFGRLDIVVVNHGILESGPAEELDHETWERVLAVNLTSAFTCAQMAARQMISQGSGGCIIFTSSTASLVGFEHLLAYGVSKGGIDQMVRQLAVEWGPYNIRVNAINPGYTNHEMRGGGRHQSDPPEKDILQATPLRRRGAAEEMVGPVLFLASEAASFVTGVCLPVDGGYCAK